MLSFRLVQPVNTLAPESMNTNVAFPLAAVPLLPLRHSSPSPTAASAAACAARGPSPLAIHAEMLMLSPLPRLRPGRLERELNRADADAQSFVPQSFQT